MTFQSVTFQLWLNGVWTTVPLFNSAGVTITRGHDAYGSWPRPTKIECQINNDSLNYDPSRPASTLYGIAGRNTRCRILTNSNSRVWAEATSWSPDATPEFVSGAARGLAWVDVLAQGLSARLDQWTDPVRSPMFNTISGRSTSIGHWPLEDDRDTTAPSATASKPGTVTGSVSFGDSDHPDGAASAMKITATSVVTGRFLSASTSAGWQLAFSMKLPTVPVSSTYIGLMNWSDTLGRRWYWNINNTTYQFKVDTADGTNLFDSGPVLFGTATPNQWVTFRLKASVSGGTVTVEPAWYSATSGILGITSTFAGGMGALVGWRQVGDPGIDGALFSHVFAVTGVTDNLLSFASLSSFNGYRGEKAGDRLSRLYGERGLQIYFIGSTADSQPMGPQPVDTFMNIVRECRVTDDCRIDDERFDIATTFTSRRALYAQTPALTLAYPGDVAIPFKKLIDSDPIRNVIAVKNRDGGELTVTQATGPASILPPPDGVGRVDETVNVNVADESQMADIASWWLAKLTLTAPRFAAVTVDLLAHPSLAASVMLVREGNLLRITGYDYDPIDLLVVGIVEQVGPGAVWSVTFQTEPYEPYRVGVYDDAVWRWDVNSTIPAGATSTATALVVNAATAGDVWTTAAGSLPFDITVAGEVARVTAVSAPGAAPTYAQTLTVTRSVNGVVKAIPANSQVDVHDYRRWGI